MFIWFFVCEISLKTEKTRPVEGHWQIQSLKSYQLHLKSTTFAMLGTNYIDRSYYHMMTVTTILNLNLNTLHNKMNNE
jgi:hypothetical protein